MGIDYIAEKALEYGITLRLKTFISDVIRPGQRMYQLELEERKGGFSFASQFPTKWEKYTEQEIREMYDKITTFKEAKLAESQCRMRE